MTVQEIKQQIRMVRKEMKSSGIRKVSCFNGGLTPDEYRFNEILFRWDTMLKQTLADAKCIHGGDLGEHIRGEHETSIP